VGPIHLQRGIRHGEFCLGSSADNSEKEMRSQRKGKTRPPRHGGGLENKAGGRLRARFTRGCSADDERETIKERGEVARGKCSKQT